MKLILLLLLVVFGCRPEPRSGKEQTVMVDTAITEIKPMVEPAPAPVQDTSKKLTADRQRVVEYAKSLIGVPYKYGSTDPAAGFDCSGFITYVYRHFNESVPRSSVDFTNVGKEVNLNEAKQGDLILFTGTDSTDRTVGHMGIIVENSDSLRFIHSTSGKAWGVTITALNEYYSGRFVKVIDMY